MTEVTARRSAFVGHYAVTYPPDVTVRRFMLVGHYMVYAQSSVVTPFGTHSPGVTVLFRRPLYVYPFVGRSYTPDTRSSASARLHIRWPLFYGVTLSPAVSIRRHIVVKRYAVADSSEVINTIRA